MGKPFSHFKTITKHRHKVIEHCFMAGIGAQGLRHDLSKYSPAEFLTGARHYLGTRSPNEAEREEYGYSKAWLHHKGRNRHHFEYWTDYDYKTKQLIPVRMPYNFVIEMFCDRVAASKTYKGKDYNDSCPLSYFTGAKETRFINPDTSDELEKLLVMLSTRGQDETFAYIKDSVRAWKKEQKKQKHSKETTNKAE